MSTIRLVQPPGHYSMLPDRVSNPGPLTYESGALPIALRGPAIPLVSYLFGLCTVLYLGIFEHFVHSYFELLNTFPFDAVLHFCLFKLVEHY